jgi:hypothetical protein
MAPAGGLVLNLLYPCPRVQNKNCVRLAIVRELRFPQLGALIPLFLLLLGLPALGFGQTTFDVPFTYQIGGSVPAPQKFDVFSNNGSPLALRMR